MWGNAATQPPQQQQQQEEPSQKRDLSGSRCDCGGSAFAELQYNVYSLQDYDPVWEHYAYIYPVWVGDFGKNNMSASVNMSRQAKVGRRCQAQSYGCQAPIVLHGQRSTLPAAMPQHAQVVLLFSLRFHSSIVVLAADALVKGLLLMLCRACSCTMLLLL
jgi:hypothetical protein